MAPTTDAAILSKMADRGQIKDCRTSTGFALDVALSAESAEIKGVRTPIAGEVPDVLLFPEHRDKQRLPRQFTGRRGDGGRHGLFLRPTSRADSEDSKFYSIALGASDLPRRLPRCVLSLTALLFNYLGNRQDRGKGRSSPPFSPGKEGDHMNIV